MHCGVVRAPLHHHLAKVHVPVEHNSAALALAKMVKKNETCSVPENIESEEAAGHKRPATVTHVTAFVACDTEVTLKCEL
jgi:hypothetical protein